ncbi:MAG TPA: peptidoglycan DD-metalloendopeptidase family protein [Gaiellaceae bacterium]|nr:peptidoglycan DD-metalloendopeptidase family protein [Gaiellaceae bacterium]
MRRLLLGPLLLLALFSPAASSQHASAASNEERIQALREKIAAAQAKESALASEIGLVEGQIRDLQARVGNVSSRLETLERELALHQSRLEKIRRLFQIQTERLNFLREQYSLALDRLNRRLVEIYETQDVTTLDVLLSSGSFSDVIEQLDYLRDLGAQDLHISTEVNRAKIRMREERAKTAVTKRRVETITRTIAVRTAQTRTVRDRLISSRQGLSVSKTQKAAALLSVREEKEEFLREVAGLEAASNALAARLQTSASSSYDSSPSASGLIWPVSGPVVSGFGMRWGRLHAGIDIAVGYGTPIHAAASGTVISAGWMGGYGNLVVIDHGGGLATAYAHQSSMAVGGGSVSQGQVIGYVGCTGHCFGPHLHFEVRVNGSPVDPLGYL